MRSFFLSREYIPVFITLAIVTILGCGYYFVYLPDSESAIKAWKFRTLQNIDKNIHSKIEIGHSQLRTYLSSNVLKDQIVSGKSIESLNQFLQKQRSLNFPITRIVPNNSAQFVKFADSLSKSGPKKQLTLLDTNTIDGKVYQLSLIYDFDNFIKPILPDQVFDEYIVIGGNAVLYESFYSGLDPSRDSTLKMNGKLTASEIIDRQFAGTEYKLFVQPVNLNLSENTSLYVIGLLSNDNFFHSKTRLPPRVVLFLITLFTCILVTFPILKLYQLGEEDRLTRTDAISVTIVSMLLMSMLFLSFIKYSREFSPQKRESKMTLANAIKKEYLAEIKRNYMSLVELNRLIEDKKECNTDYYNITNKQLKLNQNECYDEINDIVKGIDLDRIFWMGASGREFRTWKASRVPTVFPGQFDKRAYFRNVRDGNMYKLEGLDSSQLYVEQVVSWISGNFLTDISIPSGFDTARVAAMSFRVQSLKDRRIPPGYTFAMIDQTGKVLYHSDSTKNLNENLFEEFSDIQNLKSCIKTGESAPFNTEYFGREYNVQLTPVGGGLPYYLVILESLAFDEYRDINVYSFTISMQVLLFILVTVQILIMFLASAKRSCFKGQTYETDWIGPRKSSNWEYIVTTGFNVSLFVTLCVFNYETILCRMFMLLVSISVMPVFLNILFAFKYHGKKSPSKWYKIKAGLWGFAIPLLLNALAAILLNEAYHTFLLFELFWVPVIGGVFFFIHQYFDPEKQRPNWLASKLKYNQTYAAVLVSWMLTSMGLPVIIFFKASYNYDQHVIARYKQLELLNRNIRDARPKNRPEIIFGDLYRDNYWVTNANVTGAVKKIQKSDDDKIVRLLRHLHIYESERVPAPLNLNKTASSDSSFYFNNLMKQVASGEDSTVTSVRIGNDVYLWVSSNSLNSLLPNIFSSLGFTLWVIFILILTGFFFVFLGLINKIFSIRVPRTVSDDDLKVEELLRTSPSSHIFLIGLPVIGKLTFIAELLRNNTLPQINRYVIDLSKIPDKDEAPDLKKWNDKITAFCDYEDAYDVVILNHFEHNFKNTRASRFKLVLLEKLIRECAASKILILSTIHPNNILETLAETAAKDLENQSPERWQEVLGKFRIMLNRISEEQAFTALNVTTEKEQDDHLIFKSLTTYSHFYFSIWQGLSKEEKFFLFDLAEDGLVNSYDKNTLALLLGKGIIMERDGRLRFFTKGFRNFILNGLGPVELGKLIEKINDNRNWNRIRVPLVMISLTILAFIFSSQHEASTKLITSLGALAAVIPTIINFLGTLGSNSAMKKPGG